MFMHVRPNAHKQLISFSIQLKEEEEKCQSNAATQLTDVVARFFC